MSKSTIPKELIATAAPIAAEPRPHRAWLYRRGGEWERCALLWPASEDEGDFPALNDIESCAELKMGRDDWGVEVSVYAPPPGDDGRYLVSVDFPCRFENIICGALSDLLACLKEMAPIIQEAV